MRASLFAAVKLSPSRWTRLAVQHRHHAQAQRLSLRGCRSPVPSRTLWATTSLKTTASDNVIQQSLLPRETHDGKATNASTAPSAKSALATPLDALPLVCPGCGAPSQFVNETAPGYYGRKQTQKPSNIVQKLNDEDAVFAAAIGRGAIAESTLPNAPPLPDETPICDRCHRLVHENAGTSIIHPSMDSIRDMIEESPHRHNHIYHIIDAVDFPMSLIPNLQSSLRLPRLRTRNRRSKQVQYIKGRVAEVSFIITRADLLAPKKEQADTLLPYMRDLLRQSLGRLSRNARLTHVRMVSAKRGWWTPVLKEEIYKRGGAGWMVGKVNVGKSALMEVVFPKGKAKEASKVAAAPAQDAEENPTAQLIRLSSSQLVEDSNARIGPAGQAEASSNPDNDLIEVLEDKSLVDDESTSADFMFDETDLALLPPAQEETMYPTMPIISALPGTTASPIRLPYGRGRGELIDLPGVERSALSDFVSPQHHKHLIMQHRVVPEQHVVQPGQSILLGGLIRITPKTEGVTFMMYPFVPSALQGHSTNTEKAIAIQTGKHPETHDPYQGNVSSCATQAAKSNIKSAGTFALDWDITKKRAGPVTERSAGKMKPENLPFVVYGMDILIEGAGWVEVVAQVRRPTRDIWGRSMADMDARPEIEVFSPEGAFVAGRQPMNAWLLNKPPKGSGRKRPRQTVSYKKRMEGGRTGSMSKLTTEFH